MSEYDRELEVAVAAAIAAADAIMAVYETAAVRTKSDGSPVTEADEAADRLIRAMLAEAFPDDAILTEEGVDDAARLTKSRCWIVDPIDGTTSFVARGIDFDVYLALVVDGEPAVAVTRQPATGLTLTAITGRGAWIESPQSARAQLRYEPASGTVRIGTRPWLGAPGNVPFLERAAGFMSRPATVVVPSDGLNVRSFTGNPRQVDAMVGLSIAGDGLDSYEWDIAAVDLIVREAGGAFTDLDGHRLRFNRPNPRITGGLVVATDPDLHADLHDGIFKARNDHWR